jgi:hypothetical protein
MAARAAIERLRRGFGWAFVVSSVVLAVLVLRALAFTKASSATRMDMTLLGGLTALAGSVIGLVGYVATAALARRRGPP